MIWKHRDLIKEIDVHNEVSGGWSLCDCDSHCELMGFSKELELRYGVTKREGGQTL